MPVIYGGAAVLSYIVVWQGRMYNQYGNAYHDMFDNNPATNSYDDIFGNMDVTLDWKQKTLKNKRDYYRRNRDLSPTACMQPVSGTLSLPCAGCFSPFPHGTCALSVSREYLALPDGPG